jgi:hypothetical protein
MQPGDGEGKRFGEIERENYGKRRCKWRAKVQPSIETRRVVALVAMGTSAQSVEHGWMH